MGSDINDTPNSHVIVSSPDVINRLFCDLDHNTIEVSEIVPHSHAVSTLRNSTKCHPHHVELGGAWHDMLEYGVVFGIALLCDPDVIDTMNFRERGACPQNQRRMPAGRLFVAAEQRDSRHACLT